MVSSSAKLIETEAHCVHFGKRRYILYSSLYVWYLLDKKLIVFLLSSPFFSMFQVRRKVDSLFFAILNEPTTSHRVGGGSNLHPVCSSSPVRTPKLQFAVEQPLTGECWIPPKRYPTSKGKGEAPERWYEGWNHIYNQNPYLPEMLRGLKWNLCAPGPRDLTETEPKLCLNVSCRGMGQQWPAAGAEALGAVDLGLA